MLDVCLLGTSGMMPLPTRWCASALARYNGRMVLVDCGEGTQIPLKLAGWGFKAIDAIFFTHYHADHIAGLPGLLLTIGNSGKETPLDLIGPPGLQYVVRSLLVICPALPFDVRAVELPLDPPPQPGAGISAPGSDSGAEGQAPGRSLGEGGWPHGGNHSADAQAGPAAPQKLSQLSDIELFDNLTFQYAQCDHRAPCLAYSFAISRQGEFHSDSAKSLGVPLQAWKVLQSGECVTLGDGRLVTPDMVLGPPRKGVKLGYCTDTRPVKALAKLFEGSDLLICEGMYGDDAEIDNARAKKHMLFSEAAKLAKAAGAGELWLTHYSPSLQNPSAQVGPARRIFGNTVAGRDLMSKTIKFGSDSIL